MTDAQDNFLKTFLATCQLQSFLYQATPQTEPEAAASASEVNNQWLENYLLRLKDAVCDDLLAVFKAIPFTPTEPGEDALHVGEAVLDFPSIGSNGSAQFDIDILANDAPLGTHILSWAPLTDADSFDDLILQFWIPEAQVLRVVASNPSSGSVDPDETVFQFLYGVVVPETSVSGFAAFP